MAAFVDHFEDDADGAAGTGLPHVWSLTEQAG